MARNPEEERILAQYVENKLKFLGFHSLKDYFSQEGSMAKALLYAPLFCPPSVEIENSILFDVFRDEETFEDFKSALHSTTPRAVTESNFNWKEVEDLIIPNQEDDSDYEIFTLRVRDGWAATLASRYPNRPFFVGLVEPERSGGG